MMFDNAENVLSPKQVVPNMGERTFIAATDICGYTFQFEVTISPVPQAWFSHYGNRKTVTQVWFSRYGSRKTATEVW